MRTIAAIPAVLLLLSGCSQPARPTEPRSVRAVAAPPDRPLTPESAARAFFLWSSNDDLARATGDERLALSWADDGQVAVTAAEYRKAHATGTPLTRHAYGKPAFWVPRIPSYPQWFVTSVGRDERHQLLAFIKKSPSARFRLSLSVTVEKGVKLPPVGIDGAGYATGLAARDESLLIGPSLVGSLQAAVADDGTKSYSYSAMKGGPYTTGYFSQKTKDAKKAAKKDLEYSRFLSAAPLPVFPFRTKDGGCVVLYPMSNVVTYTREGAPGVIDVPDGAHLAPPPATGTEAVVTANLQFVATIPPKPPKSAKNPPKAAVAGAGGGIVRVTLKD